MLDPIVFIVDDDDAVLDSVAELVMSVGLRAATFRSAQEFRDSFNPEQPGCLVLDVRMAHMSGLVLQEEAKRNRRTNSDRIHQRSRRHLTRHQGD